jgi:hypothetical protein
MISSGVTSSHQNLDYDDAFYRYACVLVTTWQASKNKGLGRAEYVFSVDSFYPPQSPLGKGGSSVLPLTKGGLRGFHSERYTRTARSAPQTLIFSL